MEADGLELGLGLSLSGGAWGERGRILTARDFPYVGSKRSAADSVSNEGGSPPRSSQVVGWPPVGAYRMNSLIGQPKTPSPGEEEEEEEEEQEQEGEEENQSKKKESHKIKGSLKKNKKLGFVKVNLDGMPIGRKVDLSAHACYESLAYSLEDMFFRSNSTISSLEKEKPRSAKLLDGSSEFVLTYEDKEGDWMLVGDVPWRMFLSSVRRLRIMRTSEANGLAPRFQEHRERQRARPV